nr:DNA damage-regulated autophagy modulator protein 1-like [Dermatophagoides farinae]
MLMLMTIKLHNQKKQWLYSSIKKHSWIFPLNCSIGTLLITIVPYILTVHYGYTNKKIFPLISDSGGYPPGANIFSSFLIICAIFSTLTAWFRYKQVKYYLQLHWKDDQNMNELKYLRSINWTLVILMIFSSFGMLIAASFRFTDSATIAVIHGIGATITFVCDLLYSIGTAYICWKLYHVYCLESKPISLIVFTIVKTITATIFALNFLISWYMAGNDFLDAKFRLKWPDVNSRIFFLTATFSETILVLLISVG